MNSLIHLKQTILTVLVTIVLACFGFLPTIILAAPKDPFQAPQELEPVPRLGMHIGPSIKCPEGEIWLKEGKGNTLESVRSIWTDNAYRHIDSNGIPNHCVDTSYHDPIATHEYHFRIPLNPSEAATTTPVTVCPEPFSTRPQRFGVALNGVPFDPEDVAIWTQTASKACGGAKNVDCIDNFAVGTAADCPPESEMATKRRGQHPPLVDVLRRGPARHGQSHRAHPEGRALPLSQAYDPDCRRDRSSPRGKPS